MKKFSPSHIIYIASRHQDRQNMTDCLGSFSTCVAATHTTRRLCRKGNPGHPVQACGQNVSELPIRVKVEGNTWSCHFAISRYLRCFVLFVLPLWLFVLFALSILCSGQVASAPGEDCTDLGLVDLPGFRTASESESGCRRG